MSGPKRCSRGDPLSTSSLRLLMYYKDRPLNLSGMMWGGGRGVRGLAGRLSRAGMAEARTPARRRPTVGDVGPASSRRAVFVVGEQRQFVDAERLFCKVSHHAVCPVYPGPFVCRAHAWHPMNAVGQQKKKI